jgi:hypothetical protein
MIQLILLSIAVAFFFILAVTYFWNNLPLKFASLVFAVVLANGVYFSLDRMAGWPVEAKQVKGIVASITMVNPTDTEEGGIYISVFSTLPTAWYEYVYPRKAPRMYYLEYSNYRATQFERAKEQMKEGMRIRINGIPPKDDPKETRQGEGNSDADGQSMFNDLTDKIFGDQNEDTYLPEVPNLEPETPGEDEQRQGKENS